MKTFQPKGPLFHCPAGCARAVLLFRSRTDGSVGTRWGNGAFRGLAFEAFSSHAPTRGVGLTTQRRIDRFKRVFANGEPTCIAVTLEGSLGDDQK